MTTKFSHKPFKKKGPPWCLPGMFPIPAAFKEGRPTFLHCFAFWHDTTTTPATLLDESFLLRYNNLLPGWTAYSAPSGPRLHVQIRILNETDLVDAHLYLLQDNTLIDDESWHDVPVGPPPRFDTRLLENLYSPPLDKNGLRALG